jgi:16S rRNA (guanine966-N2)-methyltransferase
MSLLGGWFPDYWVFDLFGGSGVLAFEAISRHAEHAVIWEVVRQGIVEIRQNAKTLGIEDRLDILYEDVMGWCNNLSTQIEQNFGDRLGPTSPWLVFCCPPYAMWSASGQELRSVLNDWYELAPVESMIAVELEERTDESYLPACAEWSTRVYRPAKIAIAIKSAAE